MLDEAQAIARVKLKCAPESEPTLSDPDISACLSENARTSIWAAGTAYAVGARVVPIVGNGRLYKCVRAGTSGVTPPSEWEYKTLPGACVNDGMALIWMDDMPAPAELWDIGGAIRSAWLVKAAKAAELFDVSAPGQRFEQEKIQAHCLRMADRFCRGWIV